MSLYDIYHEYRSGNKTAFSSIFTDKTIVRKGIYVKSIFTVTVKGLDRLINRLYYEYSKSGKRLRNTKYKKYYEPAYNGTIEDMRKDIAMVLLEIFNDSNFTAHSDKELYGELKYRAVKSINDSLKISVASYCVEVFPDEYDGCYYDDSENWGNDITDSENKTYIGGIMEVYEIMRRYDIRDFLPANAKVQKNVIGLIDNFYKPNYDEASDKLKYPSEADMTELYRMEYGETIDCTQYSRALCSIFKVLCECSTYLKGMKERAKYIKCCSDGDLE